MTKIPELTFIYDADASVASAKCDLCGDEMPKRISPRGSPSENIR
jgi:hypothetical protein